MIEIRPGAAIGEGRYRLERLLGAGGMASVWLAHDDRLERLVAIKVMSDSLAADPSYARRFEREARTAAGLSHPNLVRVFDYETEGARPALVMEYVEGGTLAAAIEGGAPTSIDRETLARELLEALAHVHEAGIVHRDVKPANVLIGRDGRARLTDFGIAQPEDATRLTQIGAVIGTIKYLAPEVIQGADASPASDLYAAGVVLRECAGESPPARLARLVERVTQTEPGQRPRCARRALTGSGPRRGPDPRSRLGPLGLVRVGAGRRGLDRRCGSGRGTRRRRRLARPRLTRVGHLELRERVADRRRLLVGHEREQRTRRLDRERRLRQVEVVARPRQAEPSPGQVHERDDRLQQHVLCRYVAHLLLERRPHLRLARLLLAHLLTPSATGAPRP